MPVHPETNIKYGKGLNVPASMIGRGHEVMCIYSNKPATAWVDRVDKHNSRTLLTISTPSHLIKISPETMLASGLHATKWKQAENVRVGHTLKMVAEGIVYIETVISVQEEDGGNEVIWITIDGKCKNFVAEGFILQG